MPHSKLSAEELVQLCAESGDPAAWDEFVCRFGKLIFVTVRRVAYRWGGTDESIIADLVQDTYVKLCADNRRLLRTFQPRGPSSVFGWLKVVAANLTHDYFRHIRPRQDDCPLEDVEAFLPDSSSMGKAGMERQILLQKIEKALADCSERDRQIFWLHYCQGFTAQEIASIPHFKLGTKGVESVIHRLTQHVRRKLADPP